MEIINVEFKKIRITDLSIRDGYVYLEIFFDDGKDKEITRKTRIDDPGKEVKNILKEITDMEGAINYEFDGERFMDSYVNVVFQDEKKVKQSLIRFLTDVKNKMEEIRTLKDATGFIDKINAVKLMRIEF